MLDQAHESGLSLPCSAIRKRATLESDPPRDKRTGVATDVHQEEFIRSPTPSKTHIQSFPLMPQELHGCGGGGARGLPAAQVTLKAVAYFLKARSHITLNQDT